jgi:hypothetical protein
VVGGVVARVTGGAVARVAGGAVTGMAGDVVAVLTGAWVTGAFAVDGGAAAGAGDVEATVATNHVPPLSTTP